MRSVVTLIAVVCLIAGALPASARTIVFVPADTKVLLPVCDARGLRDDPGDATVKFTVAADVLIRRYAVFRAGAPASGVVTDVSPPGVFGQNARAHIAYIQATAVDGPPVRLSPLDITPESVRQVTDAAAAGAASVTGAILLGPLGLAAGALIHGGHVSIPPRR
jgi:hypothetical protein